MEPGQHRGLRAAQIVGERQRVGTTTQTAVHHLDLARGGGGGSGHWSGHATRLTPQSRLRKLDCVICSYWCLVMIASLERAALKVLPPSRRRRFAAGAKVI